MAETRTAADVDELLSNADWLRVLARRLLEDDSEVDDLVHEAWVAALRRPADEVHNLPSWLAAVVCNLSRRRLRHTGRHQELRQDQELSLEDGAPGPDEALEIELVRRRVLRAVLDLPEPFRATILMSFYEGLPPQEIARLSGVPGATVRTRLRRALQRLRRKLEAEPTTHRRTSRAGLVLLAILRSPTSPTLPTLASRWLPGASLPAAAAALACFALAIWSALGAPGRGATAVGSAGTTPEALAAEVRGAEEVSNGRADVPAALSPEVGSQPGTGSVDDDAAECGGNLLLSGDSAGGAADEGRWPQPAVRGGHGVDPADAKRPFVLATVPVDETPVLARVGTSAAAGFAHRPSQGVARPEAALPGGGARRAGSSWSYAPLRPWSNPAKNAEDDEDEDQDQGEGGQGESDEPGIALLEDENGELLGARAKSGTGGGAGTPGNVGARPHSAAGACTCPGREEESARPSRILLRPTEREDDPGAPPPCPLHPPGAVDALLWQVLVLPDARLIAGFDASALVERPWEALEVLVLVEIDSADVDSAETGFELR